MGNVFRACCTSQKAKDTDNVEGTKPIPQELDKPSPSSISKSESTIIIHSPQDILDDDFKNQITQAIDENIASVPSAYQAEHDRIVDAMKSCAPEPYLGLLFSEYPDQNGPAVNEIARRLVTSNIAKERLIDQIDGHIESSFQSRTADWSSSSRETARPVIKTYIEKLVNEAFDRVELP